PSYGISDLAVIRNGVYSSIGRYLVCEKGDTSYISFRDKIADEKGVKYEFKAYDFSSTPSISEYYGYKCDINEIFTCKIDRSLEKHNIALGCSYVGGSPTHSNGDSGGELTDGIYGEADFSDAAWSGYSDTQYEFIIDLGKIIEGIADINVSLLGGGLGAVNEPKSISFAVSADGNLFQSAGEVKYTRQSGNTLYKTSMGIELETGAAARYVKVTVDCYGWCFMDEIEIYKYE
ncbi:MAG: discoidin domain-containing protein, partial [Eubacteriales bacterium]|nr:discoidin domain-containing protein [Eubacteriales bacterium]